MIKHENWLDNDIRFVLIKDEWYAVAGDIAKAMGYRDANTALRKMPPKYKKLVKANTSGGKQSITVISKLGINALILKSRHPEAITLAKALHLDIDYILPTYKEQQSLNCIIKTLKGFNMCCQYPIGNYRIDLYLPDYKIAIECDEFGHKDRNKKYEYDRQKYIEDKLGCTFVRYNPDEDDFDIFKVINTILKNIRKGC